MFNQALKLSRLIILLHITFTSSQAQIQNVRIRTLEHSANITTIRINTIYQDKNQYIWMGSESGLARYDGYEVKVYKNDQDNKNSLHGNTIRCLVEDSHHRLWIGTANDGLGYYDTAKDLFYRIILPDENQQIEIRDMVVDDKGMLWIATWQGLYNLDTHTSPLIMKLAANTETSLRCLEIDQRGQLWVGSESKGLLRWNAETSNFEQVLPQIFKTGQRVYSILPFTEDQLYIALKGMIVLFNAANGSAEKIIINQDDEAGEVTSLTMDRNGNLWGGSSNVGLIKISRDETNPHFFTGEDEQGQTLISSGVLELMTDNHGLVWIATRGTGVQYFNPETPFLFYGQTRETGPELSDPSIRAIVKNSEYLWVGGYGGLDQFSLEDGTRTHYDHTTHQGALSNKNVYALTVDRAGDLWVGTEGGGLFLLKKGQSSIQPIEYDEDNDLEARYVYELLLTGDEKLLVGTGNGLFRVEPSKSGKQSGSKILLKMENTAALDGEDIFALHQSKDGSIWVGTHANGLYRLGPNDQPLGNYTHQRNNPESLGSNQIKCIYQDSQDRIWIGTQGGGLNLWETGTSRFQHFDESDGLADNTIYGILEDEEGYLWMSTNNGICKFDPSTKEVENYGVEYGLQSNEFNTGAFYKSPQGEMFFGGIGGLNSFFPNEVKQRDQILEVTLTDFLINNRSITPGSKLLPQSISQLREVTLSHKETLVTIEYSAMNFIDLKGTQYRYRLPGITKGWIHGEADHRTATFTHPPIGRHLFEIQARSKMSQNFGPSRELLITVIAPPWQSWWSYVLYVITIGTAILLFRQSEIKKIKLKTELQKNRQEAQKLFDMDELKSRLISNVSHELRTPLTLLDGHIDSLGKLAEKELNPSARKKLAQAQKSLARVNALSDQLFDLARFASGKIKLQARETDLVDLLRNLTDEFQNRSTDKKLDLVFECDTSELYIFVDEPKFEQVMFNLLSNAFKFGTPGSTVHVELFENSPMHDHEMDAFAGIRVRNSGQGIPPGALGNIFDRLYQIDANDATEKGGAGIGLALVKELVELHGGSIRVQSEPNAETIFEFSLPKGTDHLAPEEMMDRHAERESHTVEDAHVITVDDPTHLKILIVEDDEELRDFVKDTLQPHYQTVTAENGKIGLERARTELPDLIISDINMPEIDGLDLLKEIRLDKILSHVPVILLTGQVSPQDRVKGYKALANDYIGKPFKTEELLVRIESIFRSRQHLVNKLRNDGLDSVVSGSSLSATDTQFFEKLKDYLNQNLSRSDLTVEMLAKAVFMSKRQLERKLKDITGQTPADFIRHTKLVTARNHLLDGTFATINELANAVGFKNVKYFSRLYKNEFGKLPSDVLRS